MIGQTISGRYRIVGHLGTGGMADVWRAEDEVLGRAVAVKILHPQYATEDNFVARFRHEAQAAANLSHPSVVNVYDWGRQEGTYFIVMEFLPGETLKHTLETRGNLRPERAIQIARAVASALAYAHRSGVVHRDIKPHNIIVGPEGSVKVTDFGIARTEGAQFTQTGSVMGTAQYISPEQAQGKETGPATDIYSLGVVMYEMLTGSLPFSGESAVAVALKHVNEAPVPPRTLNAGISMELERVVLKAMAKQPELRYRSADELLADLDALSRGASPTTAAQDITEVMGPVPGSVAQVPASAPTAGAPRAGARQRGPASAGRKNTWIWVVIIAVLVIGAGGVGWALLSATLPKSVEVPDLVGKDVRVAGKTLADKGLRLAIAKQVNDDSAPSGQVLAQDPAAGATVKEGATIKVTVSLGKATVVVPNFIGLQLTGAMTQIVNAGLIVGKVKPQASDTFPQDTVMSQEPTAGASVPKGTTIDLVVSSGKARVTVPNVKGMKKDDALKKLKEYGLKAEVNLVFSDEVTGSVVDQRPESGSDVASGAVITLDVSKGPEMLSVPDVTTQSEATATARLQTMGFVVIKQTSPTSEATEIGSVVAQDPTGNTRLRKGGQVTIYIGISP